MSFQQGLSGLDASSAALDVIGNNVANASTVGFKSGSAHFADLYAASLGIVGASQVGIGVDVAAIQQQFTQGNVTTTNNPLDLAINGGGFFRVSNAGDITYTRNGQFHLDKEGYVINDQNLRLTGNTATNGVISSNLGELQLSTSQIAPVATSTIDGNLNLDARLAVGESYSTALPVFDSLGESHILTTSYLRQTLSPSTWLVSATLDNATPSGSRSYTSTLTFDSSGQLDPLETTLSGLSWTPTNGAAPLAPSINFEGTTQYGSESAVNSLKQDGYTTGSLVGIGVGSDGKLSGRYSNGQTQELGQVVLATFANPNGLLNLGNNQWSLSSVSGPELLAAPGTGGRGVIQSSAVEDSNVDLTNELVDMITAQRNYQANAQTIKTQDAIMQTLLNLR
ncbi:MAG: flagellar hook protein FlgE [Candidatus Accumulibacter sp.]|jgi:flagellar hook protein FlgE|uniref:flagellar hook protein FlgE n=1 Tax=Accumulibacter sp. TaxID=2053492 RepID=UPI001AC26B4A|nr:flagellar hook protein FlgE [Accumulibacter sp.]MBK8114086.1 flagellar hook protein FlgE [Accumulibacter sp.]MBK8577270.1 flagellar hook protein FlgE [Candidatus Accumulibacter propinquus]MBN8438442.1 flagellar hook protein FlgE [Accumulibacter sp.]